ncbi:CPBP family intramembrane glutamic endopeptidase [Zunongwangia sp. HGR-M22]|uniref:CPBP family intramembrane glutamic endopeptidase n=1 Tax=Zunongwangia sp. HGR-M22 TaxID=3015168 RepID=UPI0022DD53AB|nr:type II CAAX endopeptidase family protein [Zunongwangia sp. HGR-M22]WBL26756.1 type II CAAX endopeptidase family protein [Zunongwangia sp. HGR-M22]
MPKDNILTYINYNPIIQVFGLFLLLVFLQISLFLVVNTTIGTYDHTRFAMAISIDLGLLIVVCFYTYYYKHNPFENVKIPNLRNIMVCIFVTILIVVIWPFLDLPDLIDKIINKEKIYNYSLQKITWDITGFEQFYYYLRTLLLMPILEETFYRKIIFEKINEKYKTITAVLISSFLFSLGHLDYSFFSTAFFIGIILSLVYIKTRNLAIPVLIHSLINLSNNFFS